MRKSEGSSGVELIECLNPRRNKYVIRWDIHPKIDEDGNEIEGNVEFMEQEFNHKPTLSEVKELITSWYNSIIDEKILSGFKFKDIPVWLSSENQFNYKAAYDIAVQKNGANLPIKFKLGTDEEPVYVTFNSVEELEEFYIQSVYYIQNTLNEGWEMKNNINWEAYGLV